MLKLNNFSNQNAIISPPRSNLTSPPRNNLLSPKNNSPVRNPNDVKLTFKAVDIEEVLRDYRQGKYTRANIPSTKIDYPDINVDNSFVNVKNEIDGNIFIVALPSHGQITYATSNCEAYQSFCQNGNPLIGGKCNYCGDKFDHYYMGIPLAIKENDSSYVLPNNLKPKLDSKNLMVLAEGCTCSYECTLSELDRRKHLSPSSTYYGNSENYLRFFFNCSYPGQTLERAKDYWLSANFGGSLNSSQFHSKSHSYIQLPDIILTPVKNVYQQL